MVFAMTKTNGTHRFKWTEQAQRVALLLGAMGYSDQKIAHCLGCYGSTVGRHLGPRRDRATLTSDQLRDLFEEYDAQRNMEEVIIAASGSTQQARLRTSLRSLKIKSNRDQPGPSQKPTEELSDEELLREVESLVGKPIPFRGST